MKCTDTFKFCKSNDYNFSNIQENVKFSIFPINNVPAEMLISSKTFSEFSKTFFWLKDEEGGYCGWKFEMHRYFSFAIATLQLFQHPENVKISIFPFTLCQAEMLYLQKYLTNFQKLFFWLKECGWGRHFRFPIANSYFLWLKICVENLKCTDILVLQ